MFSYRYDAQLVPALIENLRPVVDGWISWDDRAATTPFTGDTERRKLLIQAAYDAGARWVLAMDPDERLERSAAEIVPKLIRTPFAASWSFRLRELYGPTTYRVDGIWGEKRQTRLFRLFDHQFPIAAKGSFETAELHQPWVSGGMGRRHAELNLYHLKMITPERRRARSALYNALDPDGRFQKVGYDYLADDAGALDIGAVEDGVRLVHREQHAAMHRLQAVAHVGQRTADDDAHGVVEVGLPHLVLEIDRQDFARDFSHAEAGSAVGNEAKIVT